MSVEGTLVAELALNGGPRAVTAKQANYPQFSDDAIERVCSFLRHELGQIQGLSKHHRIIGEYETTFATYFDVPFCLATSSGHGALQSALIGFGLTAGDHVLTSPYSWGASVSCILHNGAMPIFADVDPSTGLLDTTRLGEYVTTDTRAILVPHIYGQAADMTSIMEFAHAHDLIVIEDGSQAHGARHAGRKVGSFGHAAGFSTNGVKPVATTEGGFLLTKVADVYWTATISAQHAGRSEMLGRASEPGFPDRLRPFIDSLVYTYRPDCVSAILGLDRLEHIDADNEMRGKQVRQLLAGIADIDYIAAPDYPDEDVCAYYMLTLNFDPNKAGFSRDTMLQALNAEGIQAISYVDKPLHQSPRLSPNWTKPAVMWTETIKRSGLDPTRAQLPGCETKVARSIEIPWNLVAEQPELIDQMIDAFRKIDKHADKLRARAKLS